MHCILLAFLFTHSIMKALPFHFLRSRFWLKEALYMWRRTASV